MTNKMFEGLYKGISVKDKKETWVNRKSSYQFDKQAANVWSPW